MESQHRFVVASPDHPSLAATINAGVETFHGALRAEPRYFGRRPATGPKPLPSLVRRLVTAAPAIRGVAIADGAVIGMVTIDLDPQPARDAAEPSAELLIAVVEPWRSRGVAHELARWALERARNQGLARVVVHTSRRVPALIAVGQSVGCLVADAGQGRVDLIVTLVGGERSA